ncbi:hypothetical protein [Thermococcus sp.]
MQLPTGQPVKENIVVTDVQELKSLVRDALSDASGVFLKIFAKDATGKYYLMMLMDRSKLLAVEAMLVDQKSSVVGEKAVELFRSLLDMPMILDIYEFDEISLKLSLADNIDAYSATPKVPLQELFAKTKPEAQKPEAERAAQPPTVPEVKTEPVREIEQEEKKVEVTPEQEREIKPQAEAEVKPKPEMKPPVEVSSPSPAEAKPESVMKPRGQPEVEIILKGGSIPEGAFRKYAEDLLKESRRIKGLDITRIVFEGNVGEGVVYLNVALQGVSNAPPMQKEIAEKRMMHAVSKYAPVILRETGIKPIVKDIRVIIDGEEVRPQEIVDRDKRKTAQVGKEGIITLTALEDYWTYFSAFSKTILKEIEDAGIRVKKMYVDIVGRQEFEINVSLACVSSRDKVQVETAVASIVARHAREIGKILNKYTTVHRITVELEEAKGPATSSKAEEILKKKAELEKEVEMLLKQAGIDELAPLTEEKKKETEQVMIRNRIQPAMETLKSRIHSELKLVPRATFKWLKFNWDFDGSSTRVDIEASFVKEEIGGLFGAFSGTPADRIRDEAITIIKRAIEDVSRDYGIQIVPEKIEIIVR